MPIKAVPAGAALPLTVKAVVGFLVFVEFASGFSQGFYGPLFAAIAQRSGVTDADITWFIVLQTLGAAVSVPILAKLGDIFGFRRILRIAVLSVFVGTILIAVSDNYALILAGRLLMGPLAVWLPLEVALVHNRIKGDTARRSIGLLVAALTFGGITGSIAGGTLAAVIPNLAVVLLGPAVVVAVAVFAVFFAVPESTDRVKSRIDYVGFIGLAVAMVALLWGLRQVQTAGLGSPQALVPLALSVLVIFIWALWEKRVKDPAVDLSMLGSRNMWPVYATSFLAGTVIFGSQTVLTTFLAADPAVHGYGFKMSPGLIGLFIAASAAASVVGAAVFPAIARRVGMRGVLVAGTAAGAVGSLILALLHTELWQIAIGIALSGFAVGALTGALPALVAETAPSNQTGIATGIYNSLKTLGGAAAGAIFGVVLSAFIADGSATATEPGYVTVWLLCATAYALCPPLLALLPKTSTPHNPSPVSEQQPAI